MVLPALLTFAGLLLASGLGGRIESPWLRAAGSVIAAAGLWAVLAIARQIRDPRLAYADGQLIVHLTHGEPIRVPIDIVEGFLLGQGPSMLPGKRHAKSEAATLVIRLAESAVEWERREVKPALGRWCDGYITIRGTWCEPLGVPLVNRLNQRLADVSREWRIKAAR